MSAQHVARVGRSGAIGSGRGRAAVVVLLVALSLPVALYGLVFPFSPDLNPDFHERLMTLPWYAYVHFLGSGTALMVGGFQFSARLRDRHPKLHRWTGRVYLLAVLVGGIGGMGLAMISHGGPTTHVAFSLLSGLWLYSGLQAYRAIRAGDVAEHRRWMIRNFSLTFAAVTLRMQLGLLIGFVGLSFDEAYVTVAWLAWVPNLVLAEWWLLAGRRRRASGRTDAANTVGADVARKSPGARAPV